MKLDKLSTYIIFIISGIGLILFAMNSMKKQKKEGRCSSGDSVTYIGGVMMGIIFVLIGLLKILLL
jgi:TM2 domain-containing membrane protein YozV